VGGCFLNYRRFLRVLSRLLGLLARNSSLALPDLLTWLLLTLALQLYLLDFNAFFQKFTVFYE
jgi:hypothetical protein